MNFVRLVSIGIISLLPTVRGAAATQSGKASAERSQKPQAAATSKGDTVELLSAGDEPRQVLRLKAPKGEKVPMLCTIKMSMRQKVGEMIVEGNLPTQEYQVTMTGNAGGSSKPQKVGLEITSAKTIETPGVLTGMLELVSADMPVIQGFKSQWTVDAQGRIVESDFVPPKEANAQQKKAVENFNELAHDLFVPFPKEPVGKGAKWSVESEPPEYRLSASTRSKRKATYEVVGIEGGKVKLSVTYTHTAENPRIEAPATGEAGSMTMTTTKFEVSGKGALVVDLNRGGWADVSISRTSRQDMSAEIGGQTMAAELTAEYAYEFAPAPKEAQ